MDVSQALETEEDLLTYLHIQFYHPQQCVRALYTLLPLSTRIRRPADEPLRLGRDAQACSYVLVDPRVSRRHLALSAYRTPQSPDLLFAVQNLSQRGRLSVNGAALGYLERLDLPDKALLRFGEYEMLITREPGEATASFEVEFGVLTTPPSRETHVPSRTPVIDTGFLRMNGYAADLRSAGPLEVDETAICYS